jgi:hypothetical protein
MMNEDLKTLREWFIKNRLIVNIKKSSFMVFGTNNLSCFDVRYGDETLPSAKTINLLGVVFDSKLSFEKHIRQTANKVSKTVAMLSRARHFVPKFCLIILYKCLIQSKLSYCNCVCEHTYDKHLKRLLKLQKKALRLITFSSYGTHSSPLFSELKLLKIEDLIHFKSCVFIYQSLNAKLGQICNNLFEYMPSSSRRSSCLSLLKAPLCKPSYAQNSLFYKEVNFWNCLPLEIRQLKTLRNFKTKLYDYLFKNYIS